ncbi:hypothetical protein DL771_012346 [Monosporascus sp. 5C6A]|nr:hypothetical protein DL771_012346 [Monosporascus sp. 5C6A]
MPTTPKKWDAADTGGIDLVEEVTLLAVGGYNSTWLVKLHQSPEGTLTPMNDEGGPELTNGSRVDRFVLRLPFEDALVPNQVTNEVAFKRFVASRLPHIPVPRVFRFEATDRYDTSYIAEEFMDGSNLSSARMSFTLSQKESLALKLAIPPSTLPRSNLT